MEMSYELFNQVRKFGEIDYPAGGSILHIWKFGEKFPLCGKHLVKRGGLTMLTSNCCQACILKAQPNNGLQATPNPGSNSGDLSQQSLFD
jgi:hypothetical protein